MIPTAYFAFIHFQGQRLPPYFNSCVFTRGGGEIAFNKRINYWKENMLRINKLDHLCLCSTQDKRAQGLAEVGAECALGRRGERLRNWLLSLSLGKERSVTISDFILHVFEADKLKSVQIPPTFLLLHHHSALNLLDSKNDACYSLSSILHPSAEGEASSASHLGRCLKLNTQLSAWLGQGLPSLKKHAFTRVF